MDLWAESERISVTKKKEKKEKVGHIKDVVQQKKSGLTFKALSQ